MDASTDTPIGHVTDTARWVAVYRARESQRPDALFTDPLAEKLAGAKGVEIESKMSSTKYVSWSLVMRTVIIDEYVRRAIREGADTIVNLGAGLDTRPYRMDLPANLNWIEVDFPEMIEYKAKQLADEKPRCRLERIAADLSLKDVRQNVLRKIAAHTQKALVITEGVILYIDEKNVAELADELRSYAQFAYWVTEYFHPLLEKYINNPQRLKEMRNAPMVFWPKDWMGFFARHGWNQLDIQYIDVVSMKVGRPVPMPWWAELMVKYLRLKPKPRKYMGYVLWQPRSWTNG